MKPYIILKKKKNQSITYRRKKNINHAVCSKEKGLIYIIYVHARTETLQKFTSKQQPEPYTRPQNICIRRQPSQTVLRIYTQSVEASDHWVARAGLASQ